MPLILGTNSIKETGYDVANSLRFNDGSSDNLSFSASAGNRKTWTLSGWFKRSHIGSFQRIISSRIDGSNYNGIAFSSDKIQFSEYQGGDTINLVTSRVFRDVSAWYSIIIAVDTTQGTASNRVKFYINGVQETSFSTSTYPSQNLDTVFNSSSSTHRIGTNDDASGGYYDGYMAEVVFIDGQQLDPTSFGEFDEDSSIWKPIDVSGLTFGTNGFYLNVPGVSTGQNANGLGGDSSGNGNHFASSGLSAEDQSTDTCTNNFATLNPLNQNPSNQFVLENGNLSVASSTAVGTKNHGSSTIGVSSGKWYCEFKVDSGSYSVIGVSYDPSELARNNQDCGFYSSGWGYYQALGTIRNNDSGSAYGNSLTAGDILGIALDLDNNKLYFSKNGTFQNSGDPTSGATGTGAVSITSGQTYFFVTGDADGSSVTTTSVNFGSPPYSISSGNTDGNGYGNFEYAVPSSYYSLCTKNLAEYG